MKALGIAMAVAPVFAVAFAVWRIDGWRAVAFVYGGTAIVMAWLAVTAWLLLTSGKQ